MNIKNWFKKEHSLFRKIHIKVFLVDGTSKQADPITYKEFKKIVDRKIGGVLYRKANMTEYKREFDNLINTFKDLEGAKYYQLTIDNKTHKFYPVDIIKFEINVEE